jgi:disulfide bond formation protein DsbB
MNITLETYSVIISFGLVGLLAVIIMLALGFICSSRIRAKLEHIEYFRYLEAIGVFTLGGVLGALAYEYIYLTPVCELCWYQRVLIIPIIIIALGGAWWQIRKAELLIMTFAALGLVVASYHYYLHFRSLVLDHNILTACGGGGLPSCADSPILTWGFVTIPLMSMVLLLAVVFLAYLAIKARTKRSQ